MNDLPQLGMTDWHMKENLEEWILLEKPDRRPTGRNSPTVLKSVCITRYVFFINTFIYLLTKKSTLLLKYHQTDICTTGKLLPVIRLLAILILMFMNFLSMPIFIQSLPTEDYTVYTLLTL